MWAHPTHYNLRDDVRRLTLKYLNRPEFAGRISANTYFDHPPGWRLDATSVDYWHWNGRGWWLGSQLRRDLFRIIFNDPEPPHIRWIISGGGMWTPSGGWQNAPSGPAGSDAGHYGHIHVTYR